MATDRLTTQAVRSQPARILWFLRAEEASDAVARDSSLYGAGYDTRRVRDGRFQLVHNHDGPRSAAESAYSLSLQVPRVCLSAASSPVAKDRARRCRFTFS